MAIPTVAVDQADRGAPQEELVLPGTMQAFTDAPIYARTNGYLKKRYADIGARVRAGQLLAEIDTPEVDQQLQQARAELATARGERAAGADHRRTLSRSDQDRLGVATGPRQRQRQSRGARSGGGVGPRQRPRLEQLQAFQTIDAPFDGVITARNTDIGALIDAGSNSEGAVPHLGGPHRCACSSTCRRCTRGRRGRG